MSKKYRNRSNHLPPDRGRYGLERDARVMLGEVADLINDTFGLLGSARVDQKLPFIWHDRTTRRRAGAGIRLKMPKAIDYLGKRQSPVFNAIRIVQWYARWKRIPVLGGQAKKDGDR